MLRGTGREDTSCILKAGEHPSLQVRSYIRYDKAYEIDYLKLICEKVRGEIILTDQVAEPVVERIQEGARRSSALAGKFKKYFELF